MSRNIYSKDGVVETTIDGSTIHVKWMKLYDAQTIYDSCNAQLELVKKGEANVIIIDLMTADGTPPQECQEWFGTVLFPGYKDSPDFKGLINVLPSNAITKMGANRWKRTAQSDQFGFEVFETDSIESAKELASSLQVEAV